MGGSQKAPSDRLRDRAAESSTKLWLLLDADRRIVIGLLGGVVFVALLGVGTLLPGAEAVVRSTDSVDTLFQALLTATLTVVTLVLTLNQLVLSQELGAVGDQQERMEAAMEFRSDVAAILEIPVSPSRPGQFLRALVEVAAERARTLQASVPETVPESVQSEIDHLTESLRGNANQVSEDLEDARFGDFQVIAAALDFNYSWKIFASRRIEAQYGAALGDEGSTALEELIEVLEVFGPAREHFKTLYFQWALIDLSSRILAASIPAVIVAGSMVLFFDTAAYTVDLFEIGTLPLVLSAAATVSLLPFFVLLASVMRIATVAKHTLSIGPFILRETDDVAEVEWD
jgi:hypothetical protein